ncbi:MAG: hypothetical protein B6244_08375 [Candidatus Cloacimonetes bacterium 4572_55]|nr:MAG: hypothetical protein B6244_08375 [Candidatus Cloacimonetes bacterium 4572_55]
MQHSIKLTIDNIKTEAETGSTILQVAKKLNIRMPTMCHQTGYEPATSCMICVVKEKRSGRFLPACSALVGEGMVIETHSDETRRMRRAALELLLSEHVGDCEAPCQRLCPAGVHIPLTIRQIEAGNYRDALITIKKRIPLPAVLGRICPAPCEKSCRRSLQDNPVGIRLLKQFVADIDLNSKSPYSPECKPLSGFRVAIIGAGPAGLSAAYYLGQKGHSCHLFDNRSEPGGALRYKIPRERLSAQALDREIETIRGLSASLHNSFYMNHELSKDLSIKELRKDYRAVVIAIGAIDPMILGDLKRAEAFGVTLSKRGIAVRPRLFLTNLPGVFAIGSAVKTERMAVKSIAQGRLVADSAHQFLMGREIDGPRSRFHSRMGKLLDGEISEFSQGVSQEDRILPKIETIGFSSSEATRESRRCLRCDCCKPNSCKLRIYAEEYQAESKKYKQKTRKFFQRQLYPGTVIFETGKCIKCGLCVQITEKAGERFGLCFIGRGFDVRVEAPLNETLAQGLQQTAIECVNACPTGALGFE